MLKIKKNNFLFMSSVAMKLFNRTRVWRLTDQQHCSHLEHIGWFPCTMSCKHRRQAVQLRMAENTDQQILYKNKQTANRTL